MALLVSLLRFLVILNRNISIALHYSHNNFVICLSNWNAYNRLMACKKLLFEKYADTFSICASIFFAFRQLDVLFKRKFKNKLQTLPEINFYLEINCVNYYHTSAVNYSSPQRLSKMNILKFFLEAKKDFTVYNLILLEISFIYDSFNVNKIKCIEFLYQIMC